MQAAALLCHCTTASWRCCRLLCLLCLPCLPAPRCLRPRRRGPIPGERPRQVGEKGCLSGRSACLGGLRRPQRHLLRRRWQQWWQRQLRRVLVCGGGGTRPGGRARHGWHLPPGGAAAGGLPGGALLCGKFRARRHLPAAALRLPCCTQLACFRPTRCIVGCQGVAAQPREPLCTKKSCCMIWCCMIWCRLPWRSVGHVHPS